MLIIVCIIGGAKTPGLVFLVLIVSGSLGWRKLLIRGDTNYTKSRGIEMPLTEFVPFVPKEEQKTRFSSIESDGPQRRR